MLYRARNPVRLVFLEWLGLALPDRAVAASARARIAEQQEGRGTEAPALADIRAMRLLADGMQVEAAHEMAQILVVRARGRTGLDPRRPRWARRTRHSRRVEE